MGEGDEERSKKEKKRSKLVVAEDVLVNSEILSFSSPSSRERTISESGYGPLSLLLVQIK